MLILKKKSLRLTNIIKSNDQSEVIYALSVIAHTTEQALLNYKKYRSFRNDVRKMINALSVERIFDSLLLESKLVYYATCFSRESDLLSQWRGYANDGNGVAIGFFEPHLLKLHNQKDTSINYSTVCYDERKLQNRVKKFINRRFDKLDKFKESTISDYENVLSSLLTWATYNAVFYKNPSFLEEKETRLVYYPFGNIRSLRDRISSGMGVGSFRLYDRMMEQYEYYDESNVHGNFSLSRQEFEVRGNRLKSYYDLSFSEIAPYLVSSIVLGPKTDVNDSDLRLFLYSNDYDCSHIKIRKSNIPYI
jgi:hypothetical protein